MKKATIEEKKNKRYRTVYHIHFFLSWNCGVTIESPFIFIRFRNCNNIS